MVSLLHHQCRQTYTGSCVAPNRFQYNILIGDFGELVSHRISVIFAGDNKNIFIWKQPANSCHRLLQHGPLAYDIEQLLGFFLPASRPKPGAFTSSHNYCIHEPVTLLSRGDQN